MGPIYIGCAGWSLRRNEHGFFGEGTNHLSRYATCFSAVEINSSFYRAHRPTTYRRWAASVPAGFRFSVKLPKQITHVLRLVEAAAAIDAFVEQVSQLGAKLGCIMIQLPPSLDYHPVIANTFFAALHARTQVKLACEPRHATWLLPEARAMLAHHQVELVETSALARNDGALAYFRLHGEPIMYRSPYSADALSHLADTLTKRAKRGLTSWCIFDNTAQGAAIPDALTIRERIAASFATSLHQTIQPA